MKHDAQVNAACMAYARSRYNENDVRGGGHTLMCHFRMIPLNADRSPASPSECMHAQCAALAFDIA